MHVIQLKMEFVHIQLLFEDVQFDNNLLMLIIFVYSKQHDEHQLYKEHFHHFHEYVLIQVDLRVYDHV
jgi:hypothetical protein